LPFGKGDVVTNDIATYGFIVRRIGGDEAVSNIESVTVRTGEEVAPSTQVAEIDPEPLIDIPAGKGPPVQL